MNVLQKWIDRLRGRGERPAAPGPTRDPNEQEYEDERKRELLRKHDENVEKGGSDTTGYDT